jgi:4-carboxymuconolactone decarboxylase
MDDEARRESGLEMRRRVLGDAHVTRAREQTTALTHDFQDLITRYAWGEIWTRPGLDVTTRRVLVIGTLIALGRWEEFRLHARAAIEVGDVRVDTIEEIVLQQAVYCGIPAAHHAMSILQDIAKTPRE